MKAGWKTVKLGEVCEINSGLWKGEEGALVEAKVYRATNFSGNGELSDENLVTIPVEVKKLAKRSLLPGDILLEKSGGGPNQPVGRVGYFDKHEPLHSFSNFTSRIRVLPGVAIDAKYLHKYLFWAHLRGDTSGMQNNSTNIRNLDLDKYRAIEIPLPPLAEQKRIVALLEEAFAGIDEATAKLSKEIKEANSILQSKFNQVFVQPPIEFDAIRDQRNEATFEAKGRKATSRNIAGSLSLSVGKPSSSAKPGWRWVELSTLAQLESGHTPSRSKPEYWNGTIPWISIRDAKKAHGKVITETEEYITEQGVENSSARILPAKTVCLSRTASVGYCTITGMPMATSQDFVNWVIKGELHPEFLKFIFLAEGDQLLRFASGSVHQTIYYPETKAFSICAPTLKEQIVIARHLEELTLTVGQLQQLLTNRKVLIGSLKASILAQAFAGELTA